MDNNSNQEISELVMLTPDLADKLKRTIGYLRGGADALRALNKRTYISVEQALQIRAEATQLEKEDIEPLRAALRNGELSASQRATIERLGQADF